jgi:hypothetical protein
MCRLIHRAACWLTRGADCIVEQSVGSATAKSIFNPADPAREHA